MICRLDCTIKIKMLKQLFLISSSILLTTICHAQVINLTPFLGHWEDSEDKPHTLIISEKHIIEKYNNSVIDTFSYNLTGSVCDTTYKVNLNVDTIYVFLLETSIHSGYQYCYRVISNDGISMKLLYVFNGYEAVFNRRKE
jgi:hypothetical protein